MIQEMVATDDSAAALSPPPGIARMETHARYAAGQAIAAYHYRVPREVVIADPGADVQEVILWPVLYPTVAYLWGRDVVFLAGREAVAASERTEAIPLNLMPDLWWNYMSPVPRAERSTDAMRAYKIIQVLTVPLHAGRNELFRGGTAAGVHALSWQGESRSIERAGTAPEPAARDHGDGGRGNRRQRHCTDYEIRSGYPAMGRFYDLNELYPA